MKYSKELITRGEKFQRWYESFNKGFCDGNNGIEIQEPENRTYLEGWYEGVGMRDGHEGTVTINFKAVDDTELFSKYFQGFTDAQYEKMCH